MRMSRGTVKEKRIKIIKQAKENRREKEKVIRLAGSEKTPESRSRNRHRGRNRRKTELFQETGEKQ